MNFEFFCLFICSVMNSYLFKQDFSLLSDGDRKSTIEFRERHEKMVLDLMLLNFLLKNEVFEFEEFSTEEKLFTQLLLKLNSFVTSYDFFTDNEILKESKTKIKEAYSLIQEHFKDKTEGLGKVMHWKKETGKLWDVLTKNYNVQLSDATKFLKRKAYECCLVFFLSNLGLSEEYLKKLQRFNRKRHMGI